MGQQVTARASRVIMVARAERRWGIRSPPQNSPVVVSGHRPHFVAVSSSKLYFWAK